SEFLPANPCSKLGLLAPERIAGPARDTDSTGGNRNSDACMRQPILTCCGISGAFGISVNGNPRSGQRSQLTPGDELKVDWSHCSALKVELAHKSQNQGRHGDHLLFLNWPRGSKASTNSSAARSVSL